MEIDQKVKDAVRAKLLADLDEYFKEAQEMEDDQTLQGYHPKERLEDFYRYSSAVDMDKPFDASTIGRIPELEACRLNAEYWVSAGREEDNRARAVFAMEQAVYAWKNAAYAMADKWKAAIG